MFITKIVFDPELAGKAVRISGQDTDGDKWDHVVLISSVESDILKIVDTSGKPYQLNIDNFKGKYGLKLTVLVAPPTITIKNTIKRNVGSRIPRTPEQIKGDKEDIERILKENVSPMQLIRLIKLMVKHGHKHWTINNGSGFVKYAIDNGARVKKISKGIYAYDFDRD